MLTDLSAMSKQVEKNHRWFQSVGHAIDGIKTTIRDERNFRFDVLLAGVTIVLGIYFQLAAWEWCWILFCIVLMFLLEMLNTVVENLVDLMVGHHYHEAAKKAKDVAAGVVLIGACFCMLIAVIIFTPKLF